MNPSEKVPIKESKNRVGLFIINPASGSHPRAELKDLISEQCQKQGIAPFFLETTGKQDDKERILRALEKYSPEIAIAAGGDGTVNLVAGALRGKKIKLGIIPTGSANGMAYELNMPTNIAQAVSVIANGPSQKIDLLMINNRHLTVHLSDLGMNARIIKRFDQEKIRGLYGYARQFFKELKAPSSFKCRVVCNRQRQRKYKAVMVIILNTHFFGTGAVINSMGQIDDGKFEIVIIKPYPWHYIFRMFIAFFTGNIHRLRHVRILSCRHAQITITPPQDMQLDGEPAGEVKSVEAEVLPSAIEVIYNDQGEHLHFNPSKRH
ncbi:MAG: diacylglycerol/lipid kinase family protein [Marinilabiliaceae bacterium]